MANVPLGIPVWPIWYILVLGPTDTDPNTYNVFVSFLLERLGNFTVKLPAADIVLEYDHLELWEIWAWGIMIYLCP